MRTPLLLAALLVLPGPMLTEPAPAREPALLWTTLYAHDFQRRGLSFESGEHGVVVRDHQVFNDDVEIDFGNYAVDALTVGIQEGELGGIVDLGTGAELAARYGYEETVGGGQGFASIHREPRGIVIVQDRALGSFQELREAGDVQLARLTQQHSAAVRLGHVYLIRLADERGPESDRMVKLQVTGHRPGESVTFVWQPL